MVGNSHAPLLYNYLNNFISEGGKKNGSSKKET